MVKVATPPLSIGEPSTVEPSMKMTVPVGVPLPGAVGLTVAVKVTDWPKTEGFADETTEVVVASCLTVWLTAAEVLAGEVGIAAVDRGDRVGAGGEICDREGRDPAAERRTAQRRRARRKT